MTGTRATRDRHGRFYPAVLARMKVVHQCADCGRQLYRREVWVAKTEPLRGDLVHRRNGRRCGPVQFHAQGGR